MRDPVAAVRLADGARAAGAAERARQVLVGARLAVRDPPQLAPDRLLERGSGVVERHLEASALAGEVLGELALRRLDEGVRARHERSAEPLAQRRELRLERPAVGELEQRQAALGGAEPAAGRPGSRPRRGARSRRRAPSPGGGAEGAGEGVAEAARRFVAGVPAGVLGRARRGG